MFPQIYHDKFGGTLTIKAPNAKLPQISENASIEDKINYVLYSEVNPGLAAHGGEVSLIEVIDEETAILQFGGGCQGCGMVDLTLKDGVEKTLLEQEFADLEEQLKELQNQSLEKEDKLEDMKSFRMSYLEEQQRRTKHFLVNEYENKRNMLKRENVSPPPG